jgi:hypothetical protein
MMKKWQLILVVSLWMVSAAGCNLPGPQGGEPQQPPAEPSAQEALPSEAPLPTATIEPTPTPVPSQPLSFRAGLASLDSYQSRLRFFTSGPDSITFNETIQETDYTGNNEAARSRFQVTSGDEETPDPETVTQEQITMGLESCTLEDGTWNYSKMDPQTKEILSIPNTILDMILVIPDPVFTGLETRNGIETNHFTFTLESVGVESGSVVTKNQGEYWVAVDGQYLVGYTLQVEMRSGPESDTDAQVNKLEVDYSLTSINQPLTIQMPADCQE